MRMTELATELVKLAEVFGDREVTVMNEETGEILYVAGMSFDTTGTDVQLETISYGEKVLMDTVAEMEEIIESARERMGEKEFEIFMKVFGLPIQI